MIARRAFKTITLIFLSLMLLIVFSEKSLGNFSSEDFYISDQMTIDSSQDTILVSSEAALRIAAQNDIFNDILPISDYQKRRYIKFESDIKLNSTLYIKSDCNLDFNGYTLDLNGNNLVIENTYHANLLIIGGEVINSRSIEANLDIITPNAVIECDLVDNQSLIRVLSYDTQGVLNAALNRAEKVISYGDSGNNFHSDIDLVTNFYSYPIEFEYISDRPEILSNGGKVNILDLTPRQASLTLNVALNGQTASRVFEINIVSKNNYEWWAEKGLELFDSFFSRYSSGEDEHTIYTDVVLPLEERYIASGGDVAQYQYRSLAQPYESADEIVGDIETFEDYAVLKARIVAMDITYLEVNCVYGSESASKIYTIINQSYNDIYQIANMIIEELFNNQIDIFKEDSFDSGYTEYALSSGEEYLNFGVIQISYALINNDGTYVIEQGVLKVANGFQPTEIQLIFLQVNIKFESAEVTLNIPIVYHEGGDIYERFYPYYAYFDGLLSERTNYNRTYTSFDMPFCYYGRMPIIKFELYQDDSLYIGNAIRLLFTTSSMSYTVTEYDALISGLDTVELNNLLNDSNARWQIIIDWNELGREDMRMRLKYYYKFHLITDWYSHEIYFSPFLIPGIINNNDIPDPTLYQKLLQVFSPGEQRILANRISRRPPIHPFTISLEQGESISTFKGIELLTGVTELRLSGVGLNNSDLAYIGQLTQLSYLDISSNNITDISSLRPLTNLREIDVSKNTIRRFYTLEYLPYLEKAYVYDNIISGWFGYLYGSRGFFSLRSFMRLTNRGVAVYRDDAQTVFRETDVDMGRYNALNSIVYQYRLPEGVPIRDVYSSFSRAYQHYSVTPTSGFLHINNISFGTDGEDGFYIQFASGILGLSTYRVYFEIVRY